MKSVAQIGRAARAVARHVALLPTKPHVTKRFLGDVLRFTAAYNHDALYPARLPERNLSSIFPGIENVEVFLAHSFEDKALPYGEAFVLASVCVFLKSRRVFEIGTFAGAGTLIMTRHSDRDCHTYTLDLPPDDKKLHLEGVADDPPEPDADKIGSIFRGTPYEAQITQLYGDSATFDFSPYYNQMDLVFVDGSHSHEYVMNDSRVALKLLASGGTIIWDDCATVHPGVPTALNNIGRQMPISRISQTRFAVHTQRSLGVFTRQIPHD